MRIILLGPPGSGKGSVADRLERDRGLPKISTGDLLRGAARDDTPLGRRARGYMERGELVPDDLVLAVLAERIARPDCRDGYVLDGFPRTAAQAESLERLDPGRPEIVIDIRSDEDIIVRRLSARRVCPRCHAIYNMVSRPPREDERCDDDGTPLARRPDDRPEVIRERFRVYRESTAPLTGRYAAKGGLHGIDGNGAIEDVYAEVRRVLDREAGR